VLVPPRKLSLRRLGRLGHLGMSHRAREAGRASMPMRRHASARGSGVTKYITMIDASLALGRPMGHLVGRV